MISSLRSLISDIGFEISETVKYRQVISSFVNTSLKQRYRRSILGFGWSLLSPLLNYGVVAIVFSFTMRNAVPNYFLYMFSGAVLFSFISATIGHSPGIMLSNEHYIKKIYIPKLVFVLNIVLVEFVNFLLGFATLCFLGLIFHKIEISAALSILPLLIGLSVLFLIGISIVISILTVFFRDIFHIIPVILQISFFATPILYEKSILPEKAQQLIYFNPFYYFIESFRYPLYHQALPPFSYLITVTVLSLLSLAFGLLVLKQCDNRIVFKL